MKRFRACLERATDRQEADRWLFVTYDQLSDDAVSQWMASPGATGLILCETSWRPKQRAYHQQKIALILANQRQFALEQARHGVPVRYISSRDTYASVLRAAVAELGAISVMEPAERELRHQIQPLIESGDVLPIENPLWLSSRADFMASQGRHDAWRMDRFYRFMRRKTNLLLTTDGRPVGGQWSHDADNRKRWRGDPSAPQRPRFDHDEIDEEVFALVRTRYAHHPGQLTPDALPTTREHAETLWRFALDECMTHFGPYEDAMSRDEAYLFHTNISQLLNIGRLGASRAVTEVADLPVPINSKEGFIRQVLGWREFVRHVHRETDGFREVKERFRGGRSASPRASDVDPSYLGSAQALPAAFWGAESGLGCLDHVVDEVWRTAYSHHINRLMVLANWATLMDVSPRALSDWFWVAFVDAFDWVVEPNVIGMGTFGVGELMTTKPYISGSAYINKMSDYCGDCQFDPKTNCPMTSMYWAFLNRHRARLQGNHRMGLTLANAAKRSDGKKDSDARIAHTVMSTLAAKGRLSPALLEERSHHDASTSGLV